MSYEPRMRGTRFRRTTRRKQTSRERKAEDEGTTDYGQWLEEQVDPTTVMNNILNGIDHLGAQRFGLPPFNEHFQRWLKDINALLTEFETQFPHVIDPSYRTSVQASLLSLKDAFNKRIDVEAVETRELTKLQQDLSKCELERSRLEHEYNTQAAELRRQFARNKEELRAEISSLDKERMNLIKKRSGLLQRLLRRPELRLEQSGSLIQSKKSKLKESEVTLEQSLQKRRNDFLASRKRIMEEYEAFRSKLTSSRENRVDDAVEVRKIICDQIHRAIVGATGRAEKHSPPSQA